MTLSPHQLEVFEALEIAHDDFGEQITLHGDEDQTVGVAANVISDPFQLFAEVVPECTHHSRLNGSPRSAEQPFCFGALSPVAFRKTQSQCCPVSVLVFRDAVSHRSSCPCSIWWQVIANGGFRVLCGGHQ
jgi:hypothetical protein